MRKEQGWGGESSVSRMLGGCPACRQWDEGQKGTEFPEKATRRGGERVAGRE